MNIEHKEPPFPEYIEYLKQKPSNIALIDLPRRLKILTDILSQCMKETKDKSFDSYHFYYYDGQNLRDFQQKHSLTNYEKMISRAFPLHKNDCLGYYKNHDIYLDITAFDIPSRLEEMMNNFTKRQINCKRFKTRRIAFCHSFC